MHVLQKGAILTIKTSLLTVKHKQNEQGLPQKAKFDKKRTMRHTQNLLVLIKKCKTSKKIYEKQKSISNH